MPVKGTLKNNRKQRKTKNNRKTKRRLNKKRNLNIIKGGDGSVIFNQDCNYNFENTLQILKHYFQNNNDLTDKNNWEIEYNEYKKKHKPVSNDAKKKKQCTILNELNYKYVLFNHFHYPNTPRSFFTYTKDSTISNPIEMKKLFERIGHSISNNEKEEIPAEKIKTELFNIMNICEYFIDQEISTNSSSTEITPPPPSFQ